jgi:hypothetical protein
MVWGELEYIEGQGYFMNFSQQKTKGVEVLPISEQAVQFMGERKRTHRRKYLKGLLIQPTKTNTCFNGLEQPE